MQFWKTFQWDYNEIDCTHGICKDPQDGRSNREENERGEVGWEERCLLRQPLLRAHVGRRGQTTAAKKITEEKAPLDRNDHAPMRPQSSVEIHVIGVVQSAGKCKRCAAKCGKIWLGCQVPILYRNIMHFRTIYKRVQRVILDCFSFLYCTLLLAKKLAPLSRPIGSLRYFSFSAIGPCHYFDFGFTTLNLKALKIWILISSLRYLLFIRLVMVIISISVTTTLNRKALKKKEKKKPKYRQRCDHFWPNRLQIVYVVFHRSCIYHLILFSWPRNDTRNT